VTALSPTREEALRHLERLADRLRVVAPRLAAREGDEAKETLRKVQAGLQELADLAADADGRPRRPIPGLAAHALGDQALVLGYDLLGPPDLAVPDPRSDLFRVGAVQALTRIAGLI
jgi:hypothetical protein